MTNFLGGSVLALTRYHDTIGCVSSVLGLGRRGVTTEKTNNITITIQRYLSSRGFYFFRLFRVFCDFSLSLPPSLCLLIPTVKAKFFQLQEFQWFLEEDDEYFLIDKKEEEEYEKARVRDILEIR